MGCLNCGYRTPPVDVREKIAELVESPDHIGAATGGRDLPLLHLLARVDDADFRDANGHGLQLRLRPPYSWRLSSAAYLPLRFYR